MADLEIKVVGVEKAQASLESLVKAARDCQQAFRELAMVMLADGEEIKGVTSIGMPMKGPNDIVEVNITVIASDIKVV